MRVKGAGDWYSSFNFDSGRKRAAAVIGWQFSGRKMDHNGAAVEPEKFVGSSSLYEPAAILSGGQFN